MLDPSPRTGAFSRAPRRRPWPFAFRAHARKVDAPIVLAVRSVHQSSFRCAAAGRSRPALLKAYCASLRSVGSAIGKMRGRRRAGFCAGAHASVVELVRARRRMFAPETRSRGRRSRGDVRLDLVRKRDRSVAALPSVSRSLGLGRLDQILLGCLVAPARADAVSLATRDCARRAAGVNHLAHFVRSARTFCTAAHKKAARRSVRRAAAKQAKPYALTKLNRQACRQRSA